MRFELAVQSFRWRRPHDKAEGVDISNSAIQKSCGLRKKRDTREISSIEGAEQIREEKQASDKGIERRSRADQTPHVLTRRSCVEPNRASGGTGVVRELIEARDRAAGEAQRMWSAKPSPSLEHAAQNED